MSHTQRSKEKLKQRKKAEAKARCREKQKQHVHNRNSPALSIPPSHNTALFKDYVFSEIDSPIRHLLPHVKKLAMRIAPEKQKDAKTYCKNLVLKITDEGVWKFRYLVDEKTVIISRKALEILWASSHAYLTHFTAVFQKKQLLRPSASNEKPEVIDLKTIPDAYKAVKLLDWAFNDWIKNIDTPWPPDLVRPIAITATESPENWADELTLCSVAFLLHHELAHHYLSHQPAQAGFDNISLEREADYSAAAFLLSGLLPDDKFFIKKSLAIAIALSSRIGRGICNGDWGGSTHPRCFDRLVHVLDRFIDAESSNHEAWIFSLSIIKLHIDRSKLAHIIMANNGTVDISSYRHLLDIYIDELSHLPDSEGYID